VWQLEYQKTEEDFRFRVVDAEFDVTYDAVRKTFLDLGLPIQKSSIESGAIIAENEAPAPLTADEWKEVARIENPRVKELGGWYFYLPDDPKGYVVTVRASLRRLPQKTFVLLDYELDSPKYRALGYTPSRAAPPLAVQLGSTKFWSHLEKRLSEVRVEPPRRGAGSERWS
jgi:hypothetical protein